MLTVKDVLEKYPYPEVYAQKAEPNHNLWCFELNTTIEKFWPLMVDTQNFYNRLTEFPISEYAEKDGILHGVSEIEEWIEPPWEWEYHKSYHASRIFSKGIAHYLHAYFQVEEIGKDKIRLYEYLGWIPKGEEERAILEGFMPELEKKSQNAYNKIAEFSVRGDFSLNELSKFSPDDATKLRLESIKKDMITNGVLEEVSDSLIDYVIKSHDNDLDRIRIKPLAKVLGYKTNELLSSFLHATKSGLFVMTWDLICPHCRGVRSEMNNLGQVPSKGVCDVCEIDFDAADSVSLEVTFHVHPSIRKVKKAIYCSAEPSKKQHIKVQRILNPNEDILLPTQLSEGRYRMRVKGSKSYNVLDVNSTAPNQETIWELGQNNQIFQVSTSPSIRIINSSPNTNIFAIEDNEADRDALRPVDLFNFQEFRDLFSEEGVATDLQMDIGEQTIMFTDVVGSTRFYETEGEAGAFAQIRRHFIKAYEIIKNNDGAMVKTIGDAVMAAFTNPIGAVKASVELQEFFSNKNSDTKLRIRVSLNKGSCFAVNLNSKIDYFGTTINFAAKLQNVVESGQVVFPEAILNDPDVESYLKSKAFDTEKLEFSIKSLTGTFPIYRINVHEG